MADFTWLITSGGILVLIILIGDYSHLENNQRKKVAVSVG